MVKYFLIAFIVVVHTKIYSQDNSKYFYKPFPIFKSVNQVIIAGDLKSFVYSNYFGKDVKNERYTDPHSKPEWLVYELFKMMKNSDIAGIGKLYDESFKRKNVDATSMAGMVRNYTDIKFQSKFKSGDLLIVRYDFVGTGKAYAYFAVIRVINNKFYLTSDLNLSDPFNVIGSLSPNNLFDKKEEPVNTTGLTPFYFIRKEGKIFFSNSIPVDEYSAVYLAIETPNIATADFFKELQRAAQSADSTKLKSMISADETRYLGDPYFSNYFGELKKIFRNFNSITPQGSIRFNGGRIVYFKYAGIGESEHIASLIIKDVSGKPYLSFRIPDDDISNILQNIYVREAIFAYFKSR